MEYPERTLDLWRQRLVQHTSDGTYRGRSLVKFPEDLRIYQTIIESAQPQAIVEIGTWHGGSALWFADQLRALCGGGLVITVDINPVPPVDDPDVVMVRGDATHPAVIGKVGRLIGDRSCMVVEDSAHNFDVTRAVLENYSPFVTAGQWFVVEDGVVDVPELRLNGWPRGVVPAIEEFLASPEGQSFTRHWRNEYVLTCHPGGWLQRDT